jgi:hypothetical protein
VLQGLFGNATEIDVSKLQNDLANVLIDGEQIERGFKVIRDLFIFTNKRLILVDKQGFTGSKVEYHSIPYKSITHFAVETAGRFDMDAEMKIWLSGNPAPITKDFKKGTDVIGIQKSLAAYILK